MDFREGLFVGTMAGNGDKSLVGLAKLSYPVSAEVSETEDEDIIQEGGNSKKSKAELKLERVIQQSLLDPWQRDTMEKILKPEEIQHLSKNSDVADASYDPSLFERNQRIAVRDYLKQKIHNINEYSIKYQHRMIMEMLSANKQVKR